jgi:small subunit ribosomal protein S8
MTDTIADLINRINNARAVGKESMSVPFSKMKESVLAVLKSEGYIANFKDNKAEASIEVDLTSARRKFKKITRLSKPGRRVYAKSKKIPRPKNGYGTIIISTPSGVLSGNQARKNGLGGEIICEVW